MWGYISGWLGYGSPKPEFCSKEFPEIFGGFIDHLTDTLHAQGPVSPPNPTQVSIPLRIPAVERLVAIGDLHGDFDKTRRAFRAGGLIDNSDRWCGGTTTAVQVGDQLDRGGNEVRILYFLERLQKEAAEQGGALHILTGNHETMNVAGRFRYSTDQGMQDFAVWSFLERMGSSMKANCGCQLASATQPGDDRLPLQRSRIAALSPGGPIARRFLAPHPVVLQVGSTVFVHGGILPQHARYGLERINSETQAWMAGQAGREMPTFLGGRDAVVWARDYSTEDARQCNCKLLEETLGMMNGATRMVVGHTIQEAGINSACNDQVFRIDVGLSAGCGNGEPEVLEILNDEDIRSLSENGQAKVFGAQQNQEVQKNEASWWHKKAAVAS